MVWGDRYPDDEERGVWLHEISTALEGLRASVPAHLQTDAINPQGQTEEERAAWIANTAASLDAQGYTARAHEALQHLVRILSSTPPLRVAALDPAFDSPFHYEHFDAY